MVSVYDGERYFAFTLAICDHNGDFEQFTHIQMNQEDSKCLTCRDLYSYIRHFGIAGDNFTLSQFVAEAIKTGETVVDISLGFKYANEEGKVFYSENDLYKDYDGVCKEHLKDLPNVDSELVSLAGPQCPMIVVRKACD